VQNDASMQQHKGPALKGEQHRGTAAPTGSTTYCGRRNAQWTAAAQDSGEDGAPANLAETATGAYCALSCFSVLFG